MEYFVLEQDRRIVDAVVPVGIDIPHQAFKRLNIEVQDELSVQYYVKDNPHIEYVDFIERPIPLVTDGVKEVFERYEPQMFFKPVVLADPKRMRQDLYWLVIPELLDCLSPWSEFQKNGTLKRLVIDPIKVGKTNVFRIADTIEEQLLVSLHVAESLLRRGFCGIHMKRVEIQQ
jgi:hypothetical protein